MTDPAPPTSTSIERRLMAATLVFFAASVVWHFWN